MSAIPKTDPKRKVNSKENEVLWQAIPKTINRTQKGKNGEPDIQDSYRVGKLLGKGGFARVFELQDLNTNQIYAVKITPKAALTRARSKSKLISEIKIHRSLDHENVVKFCSFFEDKEYVYMILEMCSNQSMMNLIKKRRKISEAETRYYLVQFISGLLYLKEQKVIHRDLKLGNLFIDQNMRMKIGDFGLAAKLTTDEERKMTMCGTPNYIAPEVLKGSKGPGHSYEVDIWSTGVVVYTLLFGKPPFETASVELTYKKIQDNNFTFPDNVDVSMEAKDLIRNLLQTNPEDRFTCEQILNHPFVVNQCIPAFVPISSLNKSPMPRYRSSRVLPNVPPSPNHYWMEGPPSSIEIVAKYNQYVSQSNANTVNNNVNNLPETSPRKRTRIPTGNKLLLSPTNPNTHSSKISITPKAKKEPLVDSAPSVTSNPNLNSVNNSSNANNNTISSLMSSMAALSLTTNSNPQLNNVENIANQIPSSTPDKAKQKQQLTQLPSSHSSVIVSQQSNDQSIDIHLLQIKDLIVFYFSQIQNDSISPYQGIDDNQIVTTERHFVTRWVDFTSKYGLGFFLSNSSTGAYFNDETKMILSPSDSVAEYYYPVKNHLGKNNLNVDLNVRIETDNITQTYRKKYEILLYFKQYFKESKSSKIQKNIEEEEKPMIYVQKWLRTKHAIFFKLNNGVVQTNFFDHHKVIIWDLGHSFAYINDQKEYFHYQMTDIFEERNEKILSRIRYINDVIVHLLEKNAPVQEVPKSPMKSKQTQLQKLRIQTLKC